MKKYLVSILAFIMLFTAMTGVAFGAEADSIKEVPDIKVVMEGSLTTYKNVPVAINWSNLLPLREMLVNLGVPNDDEHIIYNSKDKSVTVVLDQTTILLKIGETTAYVNNNPLTLNAAPVLYKNSTYIPLRFVAEALGKKVVWDGTSRTVLICDQTRFESVQQLLKKSNEATSKAGKYKMGMDIGATSGTGTIKFNIGLKANAAVDKTNKKMYMEILVDMLGTKLNTDSYFSDNVVYAVNPSSGLWEKKTYTAAEYSKMFETQTNANSVKAEEALSAGLVQKESTNEDEIVLSGDVYITDLYKNALTQQGEMLGADSAKSAPKFNSCTLKLVLDKNTYLLKSLDMRMSAEDVSNGQKVSSDVVLSYTFSEYDGDFEINVPDEVVQGATEAKPTDGSGTSTKFWYRDPLNT